MANCPVRIVSRQNDNAGVFHLAAQIDSISTFEGSPMNRASVSSVSMCRRPGPLALAIAIALLATGAGMPAALAQQAQEGGQQDETQQQGPSKSGEAKATEAKDLDAVVVTGSRIRHEPGYEGPAPVTSIDAEAIRISGQTQISDVLNQLPGFAISQTSQTSNQ